MSGHVLAIDQGTTNTKVVLLDERARIVASASRAVTVTHPRPGWAEQDPEALWTSVRDATLDCLAQAGGILPQAIGISNQRESVVLWDRRSGQALGPCIIWQCTRTTPRLEELRAAGKAETVAGLSGLTLDPMFPAAKMAWLLEHAGGSRQPADLGVGTVDSWLLWKLTDGAVHACDSSNASRTQLFDIARHRWDETLADIFSVPLEVLPEVRSSDALFGRVRAIPALYGVPIHAMLGDSHAALFAHGIRAAGAVKATYGTGSSLMTLTDKPLVSRHGLSTTIGWRRGDVTSFALEGNIIVSAHALAFTAQLLGLSGPGALVELAFSVPDNGGVSFVPALAGLGAPHWDAAARGLFCGLTLGSRPAHLARAAVEAVCLQVADVFRAMESDLGTPLDALSADGRASANDRLMQMQADVLGRPVRRADRAEQSACGAGAMAGVAAGVMEESALLGDGRQEGAEVFQPAMTEAARADLLRGWAAAVATARHASRNAEVPAPR